jgi:hypothetical protein
VDRFSRQGNFSKQAITAQAFGQARLMINLPGYFDEQLTTDN